MQHLVEVYEIEKILQPRKKTTTIEKLSQLQKLREALFHKLAMVSAKKINPFGCGGRRLSKSLAKARRSSEGPLLKAEEHNPEVESSVSKCRPPLNLDQLRVQAIKHHARMFNLQKLKLKNDEATPIVVDDVDSQ